MSDLIDNTQRGLSVHCSILTIAANAIIFILCKPHKRRLTPQHQSGREQTIPKQHSRETRYTAHQKQFITGCLYFGAENRDDPISGTCLSMYLRPEIATLCQSCRMFRTNESVDGVDASEITRRLKCSTEDSRTRDLHQRGVSSIRVGRMRKQECEPRPTLANISDGR
jgi:hypothetical protein